MFKINITHIQIKKKSSKHIIQFPLQFFLLFRRNMAEILQIRHKTLPNQSINQSINVSFVFFFTPKCLSCIQTVEIQLQHVKFLSGVSSRYNSNMITSNSRKASVQKALLVPGSQSFVQLECTFLQDHRSLQVQKLQSVFFCSDGCRHLYF